MTGTGHPRAKAFRPSPGIAHQPLPRERGLPSTRQVGHFIDRWGWILILGATWGFLVANLDFGWIPNDDGTLAHAADRVRTGEIPHLDFDEPYPGLLSYANAAVLSLFGDHLLSLRYPFIAVVGCWMLVSYTLARRLLSPELSALCVSVMGASVFMHMSPMPTWYILFLGTGAIYCTVRYNESRRLGFLIVGGLAVGIGTLIKTNGILMAMAVGMALAVRGIRSGRQTNIRWGQSLLLLAVLTAALFMASAPTFERTLLLVVPLILLVVAEWRPPEELSGPVSARHVAVELGLVAVGVVVPIAVYAIAYWYSGGLDELVHAIAITPGLYIEEFDQNIPGLRFAIATAAPALIGWRLCKIAALPRRIILTGLLALLAVSYAINPLIAIVTTYTSLIWLGLFVGIAYMGPSRRAMSMPFALVAVAAGAFCFQFVKFPTSNLYYMMHALPLLVLALTMIVNITARRAVHMVLVGLITVVGILSIAKLDGRFFAAHHPYVRDPYVALEMPRGRLRVPLSTAYINPLVQAMNESRAQDDITLAGPDSPEVYYLAEARNATPVFFDFLSQARSDSRTTEQYLLSLQPDVFVNNRAPANSPPLPASGIPTSCVSAGTFGPREIYLDC